MDLATWINPIYAVVAWIVMFVFIDTKRIKELMPIGFLAIGLFFIAQQFLLYLNLLKYDKALVFFFGIPFFQLFWAFAFGILMASYMKPVWNEKLPIILLFTIVNELQFYFAQIIGNLTTMNGYNIWIDMIATFAGFSLAVWVGEGLFKDRIYRLSKMD